MLSQSTATPLSNCPNYHYASSLNSRNTDNRDSLIHALSIGMQLPYRRSFAVFPFTTQSPAPVELNVPALASTSVQGPLNRLYVMVPTELFDALTVKFPPP